MKKLVLHKCSCSYFRFRFIRIVARRLKITKFTTNRKKNIKIEYNRQQDNAIYKQTVDYDVVEVARIAQSTASPVTSADIIIHFVMSVSLLSSLICVLT